MPVSVKSKRPVRAKSVPVSGADRVVARPLSVAEKFAALRAALISAAPVEPKPSA